MFVGGEGISIPASVVHIMDKNSRLRNKKLKHDITKLKYSLKVCSTNSFYTMTALVGMALKISA